MQDDRAKIEGSIGGFGLTDWWLDAFTEDERGHIEQKFRPMGYPPGSRPLTQGWRRPIDEWSEIARPHAQTAMVLLYGLAGWFKDPDDAYLSLRILEKAGTLGPMTIVACSAKTRPHNRCAGHNRPAFPIFKHGLNNDSLPHPYASEP